MTTDLSRAASTTVYGLIATRARHTPDALALVEGERRLTYAAMIAQVDAIAAGLHGRGVSRGDRVALLSENRLEYTLTQLAAARIGAMVACLNWRLVEEELAYCIALVDPTLLIASQRYCNLAQAAGAGRAVLPVDGLQTEGHSPFAAEPEDGFIILYTSGTTGRPKGAVISQRAQVARMCALSIDMGLTRGDGFVAWTPMFHVAGSEHLISTLLLGGTGIVLDGFQPDAIIDALEDFRLGWLITVPATTEALLERLKARRPAIKGVKAVGCMADLVPAAVIDEVTTLLGAPWVNSFGATETGMPPLSGDLIAVGTMPRNLAKQPSVLTEIRLVDAEGRDVADGAVGEVWVRGPMVFSGYWNNLKANAEAFDDGWFHMGDLFRRTPEGYDFAGRSKYLIKSGGENIYPAEIERILLADPRVADAIVVRKADAHWGEIPVAVIARHDEALDAAEVQRLCRAVLAGYKCPRQVMFLPLDQLPRNVSGKIQREDIERLVAARGS
ncbi:MAG: AMP-binding protein [Proteobacteria bacterium]|nr:AMP-binding protein [Pseudomonadota bacterium]